MTKPDIDAIRQQLQECDKRNEHYDLSIDGSDFMVKYLTDCIKLHPVLLDRIEKLEAVAEAAREVVKNHKGELIVWQLEQALRDLDGDTPCK